MSFKIRAEYLVLLFATLLMAAYNDSLWSGVYSSHTQFTAHNELFLFSCALFLTALFNLLLSIVAFKPILKPILIIVVISSAIASFFMDNYGVVIDTSMLQNVFETDSAEATELLNLSFFIHLLLWGLIPAWIIAKFDVRYGSWIQRAALNVLSVAMSLLVIGIIAVFFYQDYASMFRNHRELRYLINPTNYIYAVTKTVKKHFEVEDNRLIKITHGVGHQEIDPHKKHRTVAIMVVGETARAEEFHLDGYTRGTTPELEKHKIINFTKASSCGTATAESLPCMFSVFPREDYDDDKGHHYENLLDVAKASGVEVFWRDNNSGCKDQCNRVAHERINEDNFAAYCKDGECYDEALLDKLNEKIAASHDDMLIVLHQKGSHGPAYYKRVPEQFRRFTPVCETSELQQCSREQIVNAYDNTILYTDYVLAKLIDLLKQQPDSVDTAMIYASDHGESLGENNLYLHGTPYFVAPSQQTHVPMLMWLSDGFVDDHQLQLSCLEQQATQPVSHDNLFHTLIGMLNIYAPEVYEKDLDLIAQCRVAS
jgi:lipid A ethanolaminephosphotransferase